MSFWNLSDNSTATDTGASFDSGGGPIEPIPDGTRVKAMIEDAGWSEFGDDRFINLRWTVLAPDDYANRKVFQKLRVYDAKQEKADKHKRMLAAIDANAGGQLAKITQEPSDQDLQAALVNRPMLIDVREWKITADQSNDGMERRGNWVSAVSNEGEPSKPTQQEKSGGQTAKDDDIPF